MSVIDQLIVNDSESGIRARILAQAKASKVRITNWRVVGIGQQLFEMVVAVAYTFTGVVAPIVRGIVSLDTATDPGDYDPYNEANESETPADGFLSAQGENVHGTKRTKAKYAVGSVLFVNNGTQSRTISPQGLVFTWTVNPPTGVAAPTYTNAEDSIIYTNPDGTRTIAVGESITLPVTCDKIGSAGTCPANSLSLTTTLLGCSATNPDAIIGQDREDAEKYRTRCRKAGARLSFAGPAEALDYLANTTLDGDPLYNASVPPAQVGITRVYTSQSSDTGIVRSFYATDTGAAIEADVTAANVNLRNAYAIPDAHTHIGQSAIPISMHVAGTAKIARRPGISDATIRQAIVKALIAAWPSFPIGGKDRIDGAGNIYRVDIERIAGGSYVGLYDVHCTLPSSESTPLAMGQVSTLQTSVSDWTLTIVNPE